MMLRLSIVSFAVLAVSGAACVSAAAATPDAAPAVSAPAAAAAYSSSTSTLGILMANPTTKAVLAKMFPELMEKMAENMERVSGMTLKDLQGMLQAYAPDLLSDAKLAAADVELAKVPAAS